MQVGINYPWIDYGWDFGTPPLAWTGGDVGAWRACKREQTRNDFRDFAEAGFVAVRWFLLCDGLSYGVGAEAPRKEEGMWRADPLAPGHAFHAQLIDDFAYALRVCDEAGIKLLPSFIDFHWCHQGTLADANAGVIKGGRYELINDLDKRTAFLNAALDPLLDLSLQHAELIYAWELINEPEWVTETGNLMKLRTEENKNVSLKTMRAFIADGLSRINNRLGIDGRPAFRSTIGFAHWDAIEDWDSAGLGATLHQFHYYAPDRRHIPTHSFSPEYPCIIGEFATTFHRGWPDLKSRDEAHTIMNRLRCLEEKGYPAAFLWAARAQDEATNWGVADRDETISFIKSLGDDAS